MTSSGQVVEPPAFVQLAAHPLRWRLMTALAGGDLRVRELVARVEQPQNLVSYHLRLLRDRGLVTARRSSFDRRDSYYHLDLDRCATSLTDSAAALHPSLRKDLPRSEPRPERPARPVEVLFVCTGNSARSPIAEALLARRAAGPVSVTSAGTRPKDHLHPEVVRVLREGFAIDVSRQRPRHLESLAGRTFDYVITLCDKARESCPDVPTQHRRVHWSVPDPAAGDEPDAAAFERTATDIDIRVRHFLPVLAATDTGGPP